MEKGVAVLKLLIELCKEDKWSYAIEGKKGVQRNELNNKAENKVMN